MILALSLLAISIACYSVSQLQQHGKLKFHQDRIFGFWGNESWVRKYKRGPNGTRINPPNNWYYRTFKIYYVERFPLSATFLVSLTDSYHLLQSLSFLSMAGSIYLFSGINFFIVWALILLVHFLTYKLLSK